MGKSWLRGYITKRLIYSVIIAWGILTITFILVRVGPTSPADRYLANIAAGGHDVTQAVAAIEARYGVDKPILVQYADYMGNLVRGNWGWSFSTSMPVIELIKKHWIYSFQLILLSKIVSIQDREACGEKRNVNVEVKHTRHIAVASPMIVQIALLTQTSSIT